MGEGRHDTLSRSGGQRPTAHRSGIVWLARRSSDPVKNEPVGLLVLSHVHPHGDALVVEAEDLCRGRPGHGHPRPGSTVFDKADDVVPVGLGEKAGHCAVVVDGRGRGAGGAGRSDRGEGLGHAVPGIGMGIALGVPSRAALDCRRPSWVLRRGTRSASEPRLRYCWEAFWPLHHVVGFAPLQCSLLHPSGPEAKSLETVVLRALDEYLGPSFRSLVQLELCNGFLLQRFPMRRWRDRGTAERAPC